MRVMGARFVIDSYILDQLTWPNVGEPPPELRPAAIRRLLRAIGGKVQGGLRARRAFEQDALPTIERAKQEGVSVSLIVADIDHFKSINDTYGHAMGDKVIRMVAEVLRTGARETDVIARYGGEEFTVVFNGKDRDQAKVHLQALGEKIGNTPFVVNREGRRRSDRGQAHDKHQSVQVTVSIGVADSGGEAESPWDVMKLADKALYRAKKKGRNRVE